jgi:hypothetical protein
MWCRNCALVPAPKPAASLLPAFAGFLLDLHFDPEDGGDFLRNVWLFLNYMKLQSRGTYSL